MEGLTEGTKIEWTPPKIIDNDTVDISYIAGLFDGEGCVSIDKATNQGDDFPRFQLHTTIHLREGDVLQQLQHVFGGSLRPNEHRNPKHALTWRWRLTSRGASRFLEAIYPYLRFKRKQAYFGVHFQGLMIDRGGKRSENEALIQEDHYWLMRDFNKKGVARWLG